MSIPTFTLGSLALIRCQQYYELNLRKNEMRQKEVSSHTAPCLKNKLLSEKQAKSLMLKHLAERGYDVSTLSVMANPWILRGRMSSMDKFAIACEVNQV